MNRIIKFAIIGWQSEQDLPYYIVRLELHDPDKRLRTWIARIPDVWSLAQVCEHLFEKYPEIDELQYQRNFLYQFDEPVPELPF